ncbi:hypothetical protein [Janthinobacterium sp. 75]|uniref:hypothetical protein n=1 Tax=Janthinobacterium sp. 75 TaxID=2135628 RepID=UPI0010633BA3|nr:hypothetical protein [Janthinobacterium sp. 75]
MPIKYILTTMANANIKQGIRRIDFSPATKKLLHTAAGQRCCFVTCLRLTSGVTGKQDDDRERGVGVAAHVYSAAEGGPRSRGGLTPEQVRSASNGLWMCAFHGREVDDFQEKYPADDLLRMKAVRELAHELERSNDYVAMFVKLVGLEPWNDCVWSHTAPRLVSEIPDVDPIVMINAFRSLAYKRLAAFDRENATSPPKLPASFAVKPVAAAVVARLRPVEQTADTSMLIKNSGTIEAVGFARERASALDIITSLRKTYPCVAPDSPGFAMDGSVFLTAADPVTGARYDDGIWQTAWLYGVLSHSVGVADEMMLSVKSHGDQVSAFICTLRIELKSGKCDLESSFRKKKLSAPYLLYPEEYIEFGRYRNLLAKIAAGWKPLALVSLLPHDHGLEDQLALHPHPFELNLTIDPAELAKLERDCDKVDTALDVAAKWTEYWGKVGSQSTRFHFNDLFLFADYIDRDLIYYAYEALINAPLFDRTNPLTWRTEPLIMIGPQHGIVFRYRGNMLVFENTLIRT